MLLQFNFKNYKSFRDDTILDLTADGISELNNHVVNIGNERILPVAAIFGANASGKSNIIEAFRYMTTYVSQSLLFGGEIKNRINFSPTPFLMDSKSKKSESSFEVYIEVDEKFYNYGFTVDEHGVIEEWLNSKAKTAPAYKTIFYRDPTVINLSGIEAKSRDNLKVALEKETLIVSLGAKLKIEKLKLIHDWFTSIEIVDFGTPIENYFISEKLPAGFSDDRTIQQNVANYLSFFDSTITGFEVEKIPSDDKRKEKVRVDVLHKTEDENVTVTIPLKSESAGTLKMFALYPMLQDALDNGSVLVVDELNSRLHPLLVRSFIIMFTNPDSNPKHAQLIFTSHESWLLNSNVLRRDEIWFAEKSEIGVSSLYSLSDFTDEDGTKIRKDENYEKNYLLGKYGAIPIFPTQ